MSIRFKIAALFSILIFIAAIGLYKTTSDYFEKSFGVIENADSTQNAQRSVDALQNTMTQLSTKLSDWSNWDDSYEFVRNKNQAFIESNLQGTSLQNLKLNFILFYDSKNRLVYAKGIEKISGSELQMPNSLKSMLTPSSPILNHSDSGSAKRGIVNLPEGSLLLASRPILNSNAEGTPRGTLIFAQYLDAELIKELADTAHLNLTFYSINDPKLPSDVLSLKSQIIDQRLLTQPINNQSIAGYGVLDDIFGKPALITRVEQPRSIHLEGEKALRYLLLGIIITASCAGIMLLILIEVFLVRRISRLSRQVQHIDTDSQTLIQLHASGNDEIGRLEESINTMLRRIYDSKELKVKNAELTQKISVATSALDRERNSLEEKVKERTAELQKLKETLEEQVTERTQALNSQLAEAQRINNLMVNRELKMIELKRRLAKHQKKDNLKNPPENS